MKRDGLRVFELCNQCSIAIDVHDVVDNGDVLDSLSDFEDGGVSPNFGNVEDLLRGFRNRKKTELLQRAELVDDDVA